MDLLTAMAASGMRARMETLDMIANNLANTGTAGYKADREFYALYLSASAAAAEPPSTARMPLVERAWTDHSQGVLTSTGNPLDLAITGKGFFTVDGAGERLYTRNGSFRLTAGGTLVTQDGKAVLDRNGKPIQLDPSVSFQITADGTVHQNGTEIAQLQVVDFRTPAALGKREAGYFQLLDRAETPVAASGEIQQGYIEASNVGAAETAVRLVSVMRQFEMLQKAMALGGEMHRRALEEVAKATA
jgi:flagellar basal-body rod protein FlgF